MSNPRRKALDLVELALDEKTTEDERLVAAMSVVKLIDKYDLLSSPFEELLGSKNDAIRAASTIVDRIADPDFIDSVKTISSQISGRGRGGERLRRRRRRR